MKREVRCYNIIPAVDMPIIDIRTMDDVDSFMRGALRPSGTPSSVVVRVSESIDPIDDTELFEAVVKWELERALGAKVKAFDFAMGGIVYED